MNVIDWRSCNQTKRQVTSSSGEPFGRLEVELGGCGWGRWGGGMG